MTSSSRRPVGVAVVGAGWLGDVHARAWTRLRQHFPELGIDPRLVVVADPVAAARAAATERHGFGRESGQWEDAIEDADVEIVSIAAPNALHREIAMAAAAAGKHIWVEKPVGRGADDARAVRDAARINGVHVTVGFNYRTMPGMVMLRDLVAAGAVGVPTHARVEMLSDYAADPAGALTWRYSRADGGHGVVEDLGSHAVDLVRVVLGDIVSVVAHTRTAIASRPLPALGSVAYGHARADLTGPVGPVENEDILQAMMRTADDVVVTMACSRVAAGEQNRYVLEVHGTEGLVSWDFRTPGEIRLAAGAARAGQAAQRVLVGPEAGDYGRFQPAAAIAMSYDDAKVIEAAQAARAVLGMVPGGASIDDAVAAAEVLEAAVASAAEGSWMSVRSRPSVADG